MDQGASDMVALERAADAALLLSRRQHEMLDDQLAAAVEQIGQGRLSGRRVERVGLVDLDPRQRAPLGAQAVAQSRHLLFLGEERGAGLEPFVAGYDAMFHDQSPSAMD